MIDGEVLTSVTELYERSLYLQAHEVALAHAPLHQWTGGAARALAGRLARHLGAGRMARWHHLLAWREAPEDFEARYYYVWATMERQGPYPAWRLLQKLGEPLSPDAAKRAEWYALCAHVLVLLRDFDAADEWMARALETAPADPWIHVARSYVLQCEDRYDEAYAAARESLRLRPWHRPGVQAIGELLPMMNRDRDAIAFLSEAAPQIESAVVWAQLATLQAELEDFAAARASFEQVERHWPLMDKDARKWLAGERSTIAYRLGEVEQAVELAKQSDNPYFTEIAARLSDPARAGARRVTLPVGFVRQHHVTCAPATLSAISRYWNMPADHLQVAEEICYNGTPNYHERRWAKVNGWFTREFTVTEASAGALVDCGIPFTLTTVEPANSHLQAVIGYDGRRGTLIIRDPYMRHSGEGLADKLVERYRPFGPRGMALVPSGERERLAAIELPDADLWDQIHELDRALIEHRRDDARQICERLENADPKHVLSLDARRRLATYDADPLAMLGAMEAFLAQFPDEPCLQLSRLSCLQSFGRRDERMQTYERLCGNPATHPVFLQQYATELQYDARRHDDARRLLKRAIRRSPMTASGYFALANLYWSERRFEEAFELYRFAASLEDKDEQFAHSYFLAGQCLKRTETVLDFLRRRFERLGAKSSLPARTLEHACRLLDRTGEAQEVLERAMRLRPDDGELLLYAADAMLSYSVEHRGRADELLQAARDRSPRPLWLRTVARLAWSGGNLSAALAHWREVLDLQPLAIDAYRAVARLLAETQGRPQALAHLEQFGERFPHYFPLHQLWLEWLQDEPPEIAEAIARRSIEQHPDNSWIRRELGFVLVRQGRLQEAWAEAEIAIELEPHCDASHNLRGLLFYSEGKLTEARDAYRTAIRLNVDDEYAIRGLLASCNTPAERRESLAFVQAELARQVTFGEGLLSFREHARATLDAEEVLVLLRQALASRPDLWHAWSACVAQLVSLNRLDEARDLVHEATVRFPLAPRLWFDRAEVCRARLDADGELESLATAHRINPAFGPVARALSDLHSRRGDTAEARAVLKRALGHEPLDPFNYAGLADLAWRASERDEALAMVERAVELHPGYDWAWDRLKEWSTELDRPQHAVEVARKVCRERPGEARSWLVLARILSEPVEFDERMAALDRALALNPRFPEAYDLRAFLLVQQRRFDEALDACRPAAWDHHPPVELRWRAAWIESIRGNLDAAIGRLQECVAEEPNNYGCWQTLADWRRQRENLPRYLEAAQALERIDPQNALSLGYLGDALLLLKRQSEAISVFKRALALAPAYEFAGSSLFDLQLENHEYADAAATIAILKQHADSPRVTAREVQLAARQNNRDEAIERLKRLCSTAGGEPAALEGALPEMDKAGWRAEADELLRSAIESSQAARDVGSIWVRRRISVGDWSWQRDLPKLVACGPAGEQTVNEYLAILAQGKRKWALDWFVFRNRSWLRANTFAWGSVGYALMALGNNRKAAKWMSDWKNREGLEPWMLQNLASGLRELGRDLQAADVSRRAIELPADIATPTHRLWLAADAVLASRFDEATEHLQTVDRSLLADDNKALDGVIDVMLHVAGTPPAELPGKFPEVHRRMNALARHMGRKARRRFYHRCVRQLAQSFGWRGVLWRFERFVLG